MEKTFTLRLSYIVISFLILLIYSSEINFMPNYKDRPDNWNLLLPMIIFYFGLFLCFVWLLIKRNISNQKSEILLTLTVILLSFAMLNNRKGFSQITGYLFTAIVFVFSTVKLFFKKQN